MTNHPHRSKPNLLLIEGDFAVITKVYEGDIVGEFTTCRLHEGRYVKIDDGRQYPQLCVGAERMGNTLSYESPEQLARDCKAKLYKTREGYDAARAKLPKADW